MSNTDSEAYLAKKKHYQQGLTIYGRKTVQEALMLNDVVASKLHLSTNNKKAAILDQIIRAAKAKGAEVLYHEPTKLSRISKNAKQDQGVALDIRPVGFKELNAETCFAEGTSGEFIALDRVTNPQNLGMIIRSVCASSIKGLILPRKGCANLDALVIKASAGTLFRAPIYRCDSLEEVLNDAQAQQCVIVGLDLTSTKTLKEIDTKQNIIFVLGNESEGISPSIEKKCTDTVRIPMHNDVESLNVAVTASLIALRHQI